MVALGRNGLRLKFTLHSGSSPGLDTGRVDPRVGSGRVGVCVGPVSILSCKVEHGSPVGSVHGWAESGRIRSKCFALRSGAGFVD